MVGSSKMNNIRRESERTEASFMERKYASLIRWLSPPDNVLLLCPSLIYERPTSTSGWSFRAIVCASASFCELKKADRLVHAHVQDIVNVLALVSDLQDLRLEAFSAARLADHGHIGHELHADMDKAFTLTL